MLKCSSERCVCAPHSLSAATSTTPRLSVSFRVLAMWSLLRPAVAAWMPCGFDLIVREDRCRPTTSRRRFSKESHRSRLDAARPGRDERDGAEDEDMKTQESEACTNMPSVASIGPKGGRGGSAGVTRAGQESLGTGAPRQQLEHRQ